MKRTTFRCPDDLLGALDTVADETGVDRSELLRQGARAVVDAHDDGEVLSDELRALVDRDETVADPQTKYTAKWTGWPSRVHSKFGELWREGGHPPALAAARAESYHKEADDLAPTEAVAEEFHDFLDNLLDWYEAHYGYEERPEWPDAGRFFSGESFAEVPTEPVEQPDEVSGEVWAAVRNTLDRGRSPEQVVADLDDHHDRDELQAAVDALRGGRNE
jgi:hypothetical protein